jgi:AcrR family transcriptional regulator
VVQHRDSTRRAGTAARRQDILDAALDSFIQHGFDATSLRQIAVRAKMTHAGLLHHFENKEALVAALLQQRDEQDEEFVRQFMQEAGANPGRAPALFALLARNRASPGEMRFWGELCAAASRPGHSSQVYFAARYQSLRSYMEEVFRSRAHAGALREDVRPELVAMLLPAVLDGLQCQWVLDRGLAMDEAVDHFLSLLLQPGATLVDDMRSPPSDRSVSPPKETSLSVAVDGPERILSAAVELFTAEGFDGTSVADIAQAAGYSKASVLYHFATKDDLLRAVLQPLNKALEELAFTGSARRADDDSRGVSAMIEICMEHRSLLALVAGLTPAIQALASAWTTKSILRILMDSPTPINVNAAEFAIAAIPTFCRQSLTLSDKELRECLTAALKALLDPA